MDLSFISCLFITSLHDVIFQYCCIHIKTYYNQIDVINNIVLPYRIVDMTHDSYVKLQIIVFALVSTSFTNI